MNSAAKKLSVTFTLVGATPSKLYQVGIVPFGASFAATFGQSPVDSGGACAGDHSQNVSATATTVELGVATTDIHGNGSFALVIAPIAPRRSAERDTCDAERPDSCLFSDPDSLYSVPLW